MQRVYQLDDVEGKNDNETMLQLQLTLCGVCWGVELECPRDALAEMPERIDFSGWIDTVVMSCGRFDIL